MGQRTGMHQEEIKAAIRMKGSTLKQLALDNGFDASAVSVALQKPWPAVEAVIAKHIDIEPKDIWPLRYRPDGTHRSGRPVTHEKHNNSHERDCNNQLQCAA